MADLYSVLGGILVVNNLLLHVCMYVCMYVYMYVFLVSLCHRFLYSEKKWYTGGPALVRGVEGLLVCLSYIHCMLLKGVTVCLSILMC